MRNNEFILPGLLDWKMDWNNGTASSTVTIYWPTHSQLCFVLGLHSCRPLKVLGVKGHVQFNRHILYIASSLTCNKGDSSEV